MFLWIKSITLRDAVQGQMSNLRESMRDQCVYRGNYTILRGV